MHMASQEALERHTARQLRLMFLCHTWTSTLDYSENTIAIAKHMEKLFTVCAGQIGECIIA
jgi:cysteinyl-tRNA synthetase